MRNNLFLLQKDIDTLEKKIAKHGKWSLMSRNTPSNSWQQNRKKAILLYNMKDEQLEIVQHHSYLDVELSDILNSYLHINNICKNT